MSALSIVRDWRRQVQNDLLPALHGHQSKALADLSFAMTVVGHCHSGKLAVAVPGDARPASVQRRLERLLAYERLDPDTVWPHWGRAVLAGRTGGPIVLILDEPPNRNDLRCLKLTLAYRHRALPLLSVCYALGEAPEPMPELVRRLLRAAADLLPAGAEVTLLADRGLAWPLVIDVCKELGWHYVLRLQGPTRVRTADGQETSAAELAPRPGVRWWGDAWVFQKSGWRAAQVAAYWERDCDGPWLPVSDRPDGARLFRDEKSSGFRWEESHVTEPAHVARLVLLMALATYLALALGSRVIQAGLRRFLESTPQRRLSLFQIGKRWLTYCLTHDRPLPKNLSPVPP